MVLCVREVRGVSLQLAGSPVVAGVARCRVCGLTAPLRVVIGAGLVDRGSPCAVLSRAVECWSRGDLVFEGPKEKSKLSPGLGNRRSLFWVRSRKE